MPNKPVEYSLAEIDGYYRYGQPNITGLLHAQKQQFQGQDPNGKSLHEPGAKADAGKQRPDLVLGDFANALQAVVAIGTFGARKYTDHGWVSVPNGIARYADAGQRHYFARKAGELNDPESGYYHLAHQAWNVLAELELFIRREQDKQIPEQKYNDGA
jgi:hypothetical protein